MLLNNNYKESKQNEIVIPDTEYDIVWQFIKYLYTDDCEITETNVIQLTKCCHRYQEIVLLRKCEIFIEQGITVANVCDIYQFGQQFSSELLDRCINYISYRYDSVSATERFSALPSADKDKLIKSKKTG